jgi:hypothetical protein
MRRLFFVVLRVALAVLLLSDVSFQPAYPEVYHSTVGAAGLSPVNTSLTISYNFNQYAITEFQWFMNTVFSDPRNVRAVEPLNCPPGDVCSSYFLPGTPGNVVANLEPPNITTANYSDATSFEQFDAPGYQLDFSNIEPDDPPLEVRDCRVYGTSSYAIQLCLKSVNNSLMAGIILSTFANR